MPTTSQPDGAIQTLAAFNDVVFTPDGKSLIGALNGNIVRMDLATGSTTGSWQFSAGQISLTPDGHYLLTAGGTTMPVASNGSYSETISVNRLDLTTGDTATFSTSIPVPAAPFTVPATARGFFEIATLTDGTAILSRGSNGSDNLPLYTLNVASGAITASSATFFPFGELTASVDHSHALLAPFLTTGAIGLVEATAGAGITASHLYGASDAGSNSLAPSAQAVASSGAFSVAVVPSGSIQVFDAQLHSVADIGAIHPEFFTAGGTQVTGLALSPDDKTLYLLDSRTATIFELSTTDWRVTGAIPLGASYGNATSAGSNYGHLLQASSDGKHLLLGDTLIDLTKVVTRTDLDAANTFSTDTDGSVLYGFGGDDTLVDNGGGTLIGGAGNDSYYSTPGVSYGYGTHYSYPTIIEQPNGGIDTLYTPNGILAANVENIVGTSADGNRLIGNAMANVITGGPGNDVLSPGGGGDTINTGGGSDIIFGTRGELAGATINGLVPYDTITVDDPGISAGFSYVRNGALLTLDSGATITLNGLTGGHFTDRYFNGYPYGLYGANPAGAALTLQPESPNTSDFNGDGHSDILWRNVNGDLTAWSGPSITTFGASAADFQLKQDTAYVSGTATSWVVAGTTDMNGDGLSDIVWHNVASGQIAVWDATGGGAFAQGSFLSGGVDLSWTPGALADFNGDGRGDILWRNSNGAVSLWTSTGTSFTQNTFYDQVDKSWHIQGVGDFNGDGRDDILWRNANGALSIWSGTAAGFAENSYAHAPVPLTAHVAGVGDLDGDGKADILWRNDDGSVFEWLSTGSGFRDVNTPVAGAGLDWHIVTLADFNDDGRDDVLWRNDNGAISIWQSTGTNFAQGVYNDGSVGNSWSIVHQQFDIV